jgi:hypothetical protein
MWCAICLPFLPLLTFLPPGFVEMIVCCLFLRSHPLPSIIALKDGGDGPSGLRTRLCSSLPGARRCNRVHHGCIECPEISICSWLGCIKCIKTPHPSSTIERIEMFTRRLMHLMHPVYIIDSSNDLNSGALTGASSFVNAPIDNKRRIFYAPPFSGMNRMSR